MEKIRIRISEKYNDYSLVKYLKIIQPSWTKVFSIKMIRTKNVLINGSKVPINYKLKSNDNLELYGYTNHSKQSDPSSFNFKKLKPLQVIYEDEQIIIVNKETGITVQEDEKNKFNNMNNRLLNHLNWNEANRVNDWRPTFIHRLDRNTSGLLIGAKTHAAYKELTTAMKERKIDKYYITIVKGLVPFQNKQVCNYLMKLPEENKVVEVNKTHPQGKLAISEVSLIKHLFNTKESILEVKLITGRTHQIRVHLSGLGFPIRGDQKYGIEGNKKKYPCPVLTAYKLHFSEDLEGNSIKHLQGKVFKLDNFQVGDIDLSRN